MNTIITCCAEFWVLIISINTIRSPIAQVLDRDASTIWRATERLKSLTLIDWKYSIITSKWILYSAKKNVACRIIFYEIKINFETNNPLSKSKSLSRLMGRLFSFNFQKVLSLKQKSFRQLLFSFVLFRNKSFRLYVCM